MIDRYKPSVANVQATAYCAHHPDGEYVKATDYDALAARLAKVQARLRGVAADATHYKARLTEAEARIARLLEITESCEWCYLDARATDSASGGAE